MSRNESNVVALPRLYRITVGSLHAVGLSKNGPKYLAAIWPKLYFSFDFVVSIYTFLVVLSHS